MANLYVRAAKSLVGLNRFSSQPDVCLRTGVQLQAGGGADGLVSNWQLKFTGVPVVLLDLGGTKSRQQRRIQLIVAERSPAVLFLFVFFICYPSLQNRTQKHTRHSSGLPVLSKLSYDRFSSAFPYVRRDTNRYQSEHGKIRFPIGHRTPISELVSRS